MASPQKENGYTAIANEVLENLLLYEFPKNTSGCPFSLCLVVIRKTWGYQKKMDRISLTQFEKATNYPRPTVVYWLNYLVKARLLVVDKTSKNGSIYGFNKDYDQWIPLVKAKQLVKARKFTSNMALTKTGNMALTHKRKKETITKESTAQSAGKLGNEVINLFKEVNPSYESLFKRRPQHAAAERLVGLHGFDRIQKVIGFIATRREDRYCPTITTPSQLEDKWAALEKYAIGLKGQSSKQKIWL